ncbi:hypothetical protein EF918_11180 [Streptomyces sp. WAC06614]|nr:hypothetical protein EF918_11180 [Streptomyces sp. WAC06614]
MNVAEMWTSPEQVRKVDAPALTNPADVRGWLTAMGREGEVRRDIPGETQGLYGTEVTVEKTQKDENGLLWDYVLVHHQPSPKDPGESGSYPGWVPDRQLTSKKATPPADAKTRRITDPTAWGYTTPEAAAGSNASGRATEYSYGTVFAVQPSGVEGVEKALTNDGGSVYFRADDLASTPSKPTGQDAVDQARKFLGLDYLWSGTSGFGYDCSGLTSQVYAALGITIPRDTQPQFDAGDGRGPAGSAKGTRIAKDDVDALKPGDIVFFGKDDTQVTHSGIYIGTVDGKATMIDSPRTGERVREEPVVSAARNYLGATRFIQ